MTDESFYFIAIRSVYGINKANEFKEEIERLLAIEAAAKECPMKWKCSKCGTWLDDSWCISNPDWHIGNDWDKCGPAIKVFP